MAPACTAWPPALPSRSPLPLFSTISSILCFLASSHASHLFVLSATVHCLNPAMRFNKPSPRGTSLPLHAPPAHPGLHSSSRPSLQRRRRRVPAHLSAVCNLHAFSGKPAGCGAAAAARDVSRRVLQLLGVWGTLRSSMFCRSDWMDPTMKRLLMQQVSDSIDKLRCPLLHHYFLIILVTIAISAAALARRITFGLARDK
jgi:hypothetical protein